MPQPEEMIVPMLRGTRVQIAGLRDETSRTGEFEAFEKKVRELEAHK